MDKLYNCEEIAERYGVQVITVWDWIRKKKLPAIKVTRFRKMTSKDLRKKEKQFRQNKGGFEYGNYYYWNTERNL